MTSRAVIFAVAMLAASHAMAAVPALPALDAVAMAPAEGPRLEVLAQQTQGGSNLVPPSTAARAAQRVVPGTLLDVQLSQRGSPVYLVKLRGGGQVRVVVVDARTGQVINY